MFNNDLKVQFMRNCIGTDYSIMKVCFSVFNFTENFENAWGADIFTRDAKDLQPIFDCLSGVRVSSFNRVIVLRKYLIWCYREGVEGARDEYKKLNIPEIDNMRKRSVLSPRQVQSYLNLLFDPEERQTIDNVYRCFCWLAFIGVDKEYATEITINDIDLKKKRVYLNNNEYTICQEAIPAFQNCVRLTRFARVESDGNVCYYERVQSNRLLRGIRRTGSFDTFAIALSDRVGKAYKKKLTNKRLTYDRFWMSGLFCRTYSREIAGDIVDFSDVAALYHNGREQKRATATYVFDYEVWKATFD